MKLALAQMRMSKDMESNYQKSLHYIREASEKQVNSTYGSFTIDVPQDRESTYEPQIVKKGQKDITDIDSKIISMYAKGMTTRQDIRDTYGYLWF